MISDHFMGNACVRMYYSCTVHAGVCKLRVDFPPLQIPQDANNYIVYTRTSPRKTIAYIQLDKQPAKYSTQGTARNYVKKLSVI